MYVHGAFNYLIHREKQISYIHTYLLLLCCGECESEQNFVLIV